ncbi:AraC family transcriptional regulator [Alicyclobacillus fodiniaquatilis]|uniref:Helix-turn-helix domain-containing protein n=1 Tax=Alicyclobacillus fodiniaquatilis TaxID=1661150 RepID=A0ABW4JJ71_9BACL
MQSQLSSKRFMKEEFPFWIMRTVHDSENTPGVHGHDFIELVYVVSGASQHIFEQERYELRAGDVFIINPGEVHNYSVEPGQEIEIINCLFLPHLIKDSLLRELEISQSMDYFYVHPFLDQTERFHHRLNLTGADAVRVLNILQNMMHEMEFQQVGYPTLIRLQMVELLVTLSRYYRLSSQQALPCNESNHAMTVVRICGYLERNYDQKITLNQLSELFHISTRQLNRMFKQETGLSVIEKVHQIRLEKAKALLVETNEKVISVASLVGYDDPAFFSRLFSRQIGCSPSHYRAQTRSS